MNGPQPRRALGLCAVLAFLVSGSLAPSGGDPCPRHEPSGPTTSASSEHVEHAGHGPDAHSDAPTEDHGHACHCIGACCPGVTAGHPGPASTSFSASAGVLRRVEFPSGIDVERPDPWLLPYANGPPAFS